MIEGVGTLSTGAFFLISKMSLNQRPPDNIHGIYSYCNNETDDAGDEFPENGRQICTEQFWEIL